MQIHLAVGMSYTLLLPLHLFSSRLYILVSFLSFFLILFINLSSILPPFFFWEEKSKFSNALRTIAKSETNNDLIFEDFVFEDTLCCSDKSQSFVTKSSFKNNRKTKDHSDSKLFFNVETSINSPSLLLATPNQSSLVSEPNSSIFIGVLANCSAIQVRLGVPDIARDLH